MNKEELIHMLLAEANKVGDDTHADLMRAAADMLWEHPDTKMFKNFHRNLCKRFGYYHDEEDWRRDLASLEEWIAKPDPRIENRLAAYQGGIALLAKEVTELKEQLKFKG